MVSRHHGVVILAVFAVLCALLAPARAEDVVTPEERKQILDQHNAYRARHCVPPMTWSAELAKGAQEWANKCRLSHAPRDPWGENLAWGYQRPASDALEAWYKEVSLYDHARPVFDPATAHFTQMIWKGTRQVGCGVATCLWGSFRYWVCRYSPQGNWAGKFTENVPKRCQ